MATRGHDALYTGLDWLGVIEIPGWGRGNGVLRFSIAENDWSVLGICLGLG